MDNNGPITNKDVGRLLVELGFTRRDEIPEKFKTVWKHQAAGTTIVLPANRTQESPLEVDLIAVRNQLHYNGHLNRDEFDAFVKTGKPVVQ